VNGADLTGTVLKKRGEPAMLLHSPWEQLQAETTGLALIPSSRWNLRDILNEIPDRFQAYNDLAGALRQQGKRDDAERAMATFQRIQDRQARIRFPIDPPAWRSAAASGDGLASAPRPCQPPLHR